MSRSTRIATLALSLAFGSPALPGAARFCRAAEPVLPGYSVQPVVSIKAAPFPLGDVQLLDSPFKHAMERDHDYLLKLEPDRLLAWFRREAGLPEKGRVYGGWETQGVAGHSLGHYLTAASMMYRDTGDERLRLRINYIVEELATCQKANGNGYVAAIPGGKEVFAKVARGDIASKGFDLNGSWVPWYTIHKEMAGLRDAYRFCGNEKAKAVLVALADWAIDTTRNLNDDQWQRMLNCEHGGMNEVLADVYALTGDRKYLDLAEKFYHKAILDPIARDSDILPGKHANTQIPKIVGAARIYELTGDAKFASIARNFWDIVVAHHTYVTGGNSDGEYFGPEDRLAARLSPSTTETCNTNNMLRLTKRLIMEDPRPAYGDYCERALYNHILASQNPDTGMMCYFVPLGNNVYKTFSTPYDTFTCCVGTGMENHARYPESIYFHGSDTLFVNLFIPSELNWKARGMRIRQESRFPAEPNSSLRISTPAPQKLAILIRHPWWCAGFGVSVNGQPLKTTSKPGSYLTLEREWRDGDRIDIALPMTLHTWPMPDNPRRVALMYGPLVLAGEFGPQDRPGQPHELVADPDHLTDFIKPVDGKPLTFRTEKIGKPNDVTFIPFYATYQGRYGVYFDIYTPDEYKAREAQIAAEQARIREIEARTVDVMAIGEMQPERDHNLQGEKTSAGDFNGRKWRHATDGGWFSFDVKVAKETSSSLVVTYWGSDGSNRLFDILIDGQKIATQRLENNKPGQFIDVSYAIPAALTRNKEKVTVRFQAHPGCWAGGVFGARVLKDQKKP